MAKDDDDDKDLDAVTDEGEGEGETVVVDDKAARAAKKEDERLAQDDDDEGEVDAATEAIRAQRRLERKAKKIREHQARERTAKELAYARARLDQLEPLARRFAELESRTLNTEYTQVDDRLNQIDREMEKARAIEADAITKQDGAAASAARKILDDLKDTRAQHINYKAQLAEEARTRAAGAERGTEARTETRTDTRRADPEVARLAKEWRESNPWYSTKRDNQDSLITSAIDQQIAREGFDPSTEEYWEELTKRVQEVLPHIAGGTRQSNGQGNGTGNGHARTNGSRGPAMANAQRESRAVKPGEFYVNAERKAAMIEAGVWDDPVLRKRQLKRYQEYDREHPETA